MAEDYAIENEKKYISLLQNIIAELPPYCKDFFRSKAQTTSALTRYAYAIDLRMFFNYIIKIVPELSARYDIRDITVKDLGCVTRSHIEDYLDHVSLYDADDKTRINRDEAKMRKLSSLRSFYGYLYKNELVDKPTPSLVELPKLHQKPIVYLEPNEIVDILECAESNDKQNMSEHQKKYAQHTRKRDVAILTLFLGTGIRVSELVGIDVDDINFFNNEFGIVRKGGNRDVLSFGQEVRTALLDYMTLRETITPLPGHERALFLSLQRRRITVRAVENLVKKYASVAVPQKRITPHKLRSTFGTMLYGETGDIYLVADVMGHKDVNTTRKHYASMSKERRRAAAEAIKLKDDE